MKLDEFQIKLKQQQLDGAIIFSKDANFFYFVQTKLDDSFLFVPVKGKPLIFTSKLESINSSIKTIIYEEPYKDLSEFFKKNKIKKIGVNESSISVKQEKKLLKLVKTEDIESILISLRIIKTKKEIEYMSVACLKTERVLKRIVKKFNFKTEKEIRDFIRLEAIKEGCELSFNPIIASDKNSSKPHYNSSQKLKKGFLLIDFGLKYKGYCADLTRMLYLGNPTQRELKKYNELLGVQTAVIKIIKPGLKIKTLELYVRGLLGVKENNFIHSLGHGLGIKVHEHPSVNKHSEEVLEQNMVITIEPGIYSNFGMRIEDDVQVTNKGFNLLTKFSKELMIIPKF